MPTSNVHPITQLVKNFFDKLRQSPDVYPIRYYKKAKRNKRVVYSSFAK
jgi:hypothetical protein